MAEAKSSKVLRYAVIQGGKVIEDRTLDRNQSVTIGSDTKNTIVVPMGNLPKSHAVFELRGAQYHLCFTDSMEGKLSTAQANEKLSFEALKSQGVAKKKGDRYEVPLADSSKGSVSLGEVTLLFQFVNQPKAAPKMELPAAAKGSLLNTIDRTFTAILLSFLFIEFTGAFALSRRAIVEDDISLDELPDRFVKLVIPEKPKEPPKPVEEKKDDKPVEEKKEEEKVAEKKEPPKATQEHHDKVVAAVQSKGLLKLLGSNGQNNMMNAITDTLGAGGAAANLDQALAGAGGVTTANDDPSLTGPTGGGSGDVAKIGDIGTQGGGAVETSHHEVKQISGRVLDSAPEVESGDIDRDSLARFVKVRLKSIQACYERELKRNTSLKGKIVVRFVIAETGRVKDVDIDENTMGSDEVANCIKTTIRAWTTQFHPSGEVPVSYPFVFSPSN